jgi:inosose dehydratase
MDGRLAAAAPSAADAAACEHVLDEVRSLGFRAVEAGPEGWLPADPQLAGRLLRRFELELAAGEVEAVLHLPEVRRDELARVERRARWLVAVGGRLLTVVAAAGKPAEELTVHCWLRLLDGIASVMEICARRGLHVALRPKVGSVIERPPDVERLLVGSEVALCLDAGQLFQGGCDPADVVHMAPNRIKHVHLKDVDGWRGAIPEVVESLRAARYRGWYVVDTDLV